MGRRQTSLRNISLTVIGAIALGVLSFIADVTGILDYLGIGVLPTAAPTSTQNDVIVAQQVQVCMERHGLKNAHDVIEESDIDTQFVRLFLFCDWPPPAYAEPDGFTQIRVELVPTTEIKIASDKGMASLIAPSANRIQSNCRTVRLYYYFVRQTVYDHYPPVEVSVGQVVHIRNLVFGDNITSDARGIPLDDAFLLNFYPKRNELVVLSLIEEHLDKVECVK